jgi:hypothetical protein
MLAKRAAQIYPRSNPSNAGTKQLDKFHARRTLPVDMRQAMRDLRKQIEGGEGLSVDPVRGGIPRMPVTIRVKSASAGFAPKGTYCLSGMICSSNFIELKTFLMADRKLANIYAVS